MVQTVIAQEGDNDDCAHDVVNIYLYTCIFVQTCQQSLTRFY